MTTKDMTTIAMFTVLISISAQISIPFGIIPFTLQPVLILMSGILLGYRRGTYAVIIYVLIGAVGLPVFANFKGGLSALFLESGGFIMSFPIMAFVSGFIYNIKKNILFTYIGCIISVFINFLCGSLYFMFLTDVTYKQSLIYTVYPFIITTILQIIISVHFSLYIKKLNIIEEKN